MMKTNASQCSGTLKKTICTRCNTNLSNKNRIQQDEHESNCRKQEKLQ